MELLERSTQLDALGGAVASATAGHGRVALVYGEAGIGKTTLVRTFTHTVTGAVRVLWGGCDDLATPRSLGPILDLADEVPAPLREAIRAGAPAYEQVLAELSRPPSPVLLVVEDLHWADEATLDLLTFLVRRLDDRPALLILTYRSDELASVHPLRRVLGRIPSHLAVRIRLEPLSLGAVTRLAGPRAAEIHRLTGGNPFYVTELLSDTQQTPPMLTSTVLARTRRLPPPTRRLLELVSLSPSRVEAAVLDRCTPSWQTDIEAAEQRGLVTVAGDAVSFRHEVARRALADSVPASRAVVLHQQLLSALADVDADPARLVHHAFAAGDEAAVLRYGLAAARRAARLRSHREAVEHYRRVDAFSAALPARERADLHAERMEACLRAGELAEALAVGEVCLAEQRRLGHLPETGRTLARLAQVHWTFGNRAAADRCCDEAIRLAAGGTAAGWALAVRAGNAMAAWDRETTLRLGGQARRMAAQTDDQELLAYVLMVLGQTLLEHDADGEDLLERSIEVAAAIGDHDQVSTALANLAGAAVERHRPEIAQRHLDRGACYADEHDVVTVAEYLAGLRSRLELDRGRWSDAEALARWVLRQDSDSRVNRHNALCTLARLEVRRGTAGAAAAVAEAVSEAAHSGELQWIVPAALARAEWLEHTGGLDAECPVLQDLFAKVVPTRVAWATGEVGRWLVRAGGRVDPATLVAPYALEVAGRWSEAAANWAAGGCPYEQADALSHSEQTADLVTALGIFERLGAAAAVGRVRTLLRTRGVRLPHQRATISEAGPAGLTVRQAEVLALLAQGLTNVEIAERFVVSVRTVDHHVAAILARLGVQNRRQAAERARQLGLLPPQHSTVQP